jgi:glycosyltransferase involved in cell wall biosynthesis
METVRFTSLSPVEITGARDRKFWEIPKILAAIDEPLLSVYAPLGLTESLFTRWPRDSSMDASQFPERWERMRDQSRPWMFLVSSPSKIGDLPQKLGMADYSYGFVLKSLAPVLERLGQWRPVISPESCLVYAAAQAVEEGFRPVHLAMVPVHAAYLTPAVPTILFPFWEFPRIPDRDFGCLTRHNWARVARRASLIVTACEMTAQSFRRAGVECPVEVVPVPIEERTFSVPPWSPDFTWRITCRHVSLGGPRLDPDEPAAPDPSPAPRAPSVGGEGLTDRYRRYIRPWLPPRAQDAVSRCKRRVLQAMHRGEPVVAEPLRRVRATDLELSGLVYSTVFNLADQRKNPHDLITAFLLAFSDRTDVTLVLKLATTPETEFYHVEYLRSLCLGYGIEHRCRVVIIADYLSDDELLGLFRATTFYVNTSRAEGACLPLQQALACGRPAIAPAHTAMADYMDDRVGFVVASQPEPTHWPHEPQKRIVTNWQRLVWPSLRDQYLRSAEMASSRRMEYEVMGAAAHHRMKNYASVDVVTEAFRRVVDRLREAPLGRLGWEEDRVA